MKKTWKDLNVHDAVSEFKEAVGWFEATIGAKNVERLQERVEDLYKKAFKHGIRLAAEVASDYDHLSSHDYLVSDCILGKLNVSPKKPRKNRKSR